MNKNGLKRVQVEVRDGEGRVFQVISGHFSRYALKRTVRQVVERAGPGATVKTQHDGAAQ